MTLAVVLACTGALTVGTSRPAQADGAWMGFPIPKTKYADSGWIGGRSLGPAHAYRIQPRRLGFTTAYQRPRRVADLKGPEAGPSRRMTRRAAYVLANFGGYPEPIQAAATDAVVYHLLVGGGYRIGTGRGAERIRQSGESQEQIRAYARAMLRDSARHAGPYRIRLRAKPAQVGSTTKVTLRVRSATGRAMTGLPVRFRYPSASDATSFTDAKGRATAFFTVTAPGQTTVTARVSRLPHWKLFLRHPKAARASAVALAGRLASRRVRTRVLAAGAQSVSIANAAATIMTAQNLGGSYTVSGGTGTRAVTARVFGPFDTASTSCSGTPAFSDASSIEADGTRRLPIWPPQRSGYYVWEVAVGGNQGSAAARVCGAAVRVRTQAGLTQSRPAGQCCHQVAVGEGFRVHVRSTGFDRAETHTVTSRLYGPYAARDKVSCGAGKHLGSKDVTANLSGNKEFDMPAVVINASGRTGWYGWKSTLSTGTLIVGKTTGCGVVYQVTG